MNMGNNDQHVAAGRIGGMAPRRLRPIMDRFMEKISPEPNTGCWLWASAVMSRGCGAIRINGKQCIASRVAWELFRGPIPVGHFVCHSCDNGTIGCCNPDHLWTGTPQDNMDDMSRKGRGNNGHKKKTHCPRGHEYNAENTVYARDSRRRGLSRQCRTCANASSLRRWRAKQASSIAPSAPQAGATDAKETKP